MRVFVAILIAVAFLATAALADEQHGKAIEKKVSDDFTISAPVKVGGKILPAGRYRIQCNGKEIIFEQANGEKVVFPCRGKELPVKASATEMHMNVENGERTVTTLLLRGSNVEHVF